jgi:hypothetical protein
MDVFLNQFLFKCFINEIKIFLIFNTKKMRISNTNYKNVSYDKARGRYRIEMRIGKLPRTARVKDLQSAILITNTNTNTIFIIVTLPAKPHKTVSISSVVGVALNAWQNTGYDFQTITSQNR